MPAGHTVGVAHPATVVLAPALIGTGDLPDPALPDHVHDAEGLGVVLDPVGDLPPVGLMHE